MSFVRRVSSGSARLDDILHGGLPENAINLIIGPPGGGKTILADQYLFHNASEDRPAVNYSTVSEPHDKMLRYGQSLSFFDTAAVGRRVFYEALGPDLRAGGLDAVVERISADIKARRPSVIVIDSFRALAAYAEPEAFRTFLADLADVVTAFPVTVFWVGEYSPADIAEKPEFAVADSILSLSREDSGVREFRYLQVLKLRGSGYLSGKHACRLGADGIDVYPRIADPGDPTAYETATGRTSSGIPAVDMLTDDGFLAGSSTLIAGPSGIGKTLMGMHFVFWGARIGEPSLIASFQENPSQLEGILTAFGWSLAEENVYMFYDSAVDLYVDEWMSKVLDLVRDRGIKRVLVDSLGDLEIVAADPMRFREFVYSFIQRATRAGVSVMFTMELPELFRVQRLSEHSFSHLTDNVVLLQYVHEDSTLKRALTVIKSRGTRHDARVHEFDITDDGVALVETLDMATYRPD